MRAHSEKHVLDILACVGTKHDLRLVLLAALICALGAVTAMQAFARAQKASPAQRAPWLILAGAAGGAGVWATHFVAMLAYSPGLPIQYGVGMSAASLAIVIGGACGGFLIAGSGKGRPLLGGAVVGAAIAVMHYCGVGAIHAFHVSWNAAYVVASIMASLVGAAFALAVGHRRGVPAQVFAPIILVLAICGLHFTAMTGMTVTPDLTTGVSPELISRPILAIVVGLVVLLILVTASILIVMEAHSRQSNHRTLDTVFQSSPQGMALFDPSGRMVLWNEAFGELLAAMGVEAAVGLSEADLNDRVTNGDKATLEPLTPIRALIDGVPAETEARLTDGRILNIDRRMLDDGSHLSILADVTDQRRWAEAMEEARRKAEAANRAKSEFLANISHELRTPLNGVLGMVQVIERDELSPAQRVRTEVVHESACALLRALDDVLDLARIETGRTSLTIEPFDLLDLTLSVAGMFTSAAVNKGLKLDVAATPSAAGQWLGDGVKLRRLLNHLMDNAVKFTAAGSIRLDVSCEGEDLLFRVQDTGIGFDPAESERLFETFVQGDNSATRRFGGAGVGLSLCREWAHAMGGAISAEGKPGKGACFTLRLRLARAEASAAPDAGHVAPPPAAPIQMQGGQMQGAEASGGEDRPLRVLAAEDNETNQLVLKSLLQTMDVDLTVAPNGRVAVERFEAEAFDLVLMDIQMPEMNGVDAARAIRAFERSRGQAQTPIIALTANVMADQVAEYRAVGMNDCVPKPIELERLFNAMAAALNRGAEEAAA